MKEGCMDGSFSVETMNFLSNNYKLVLIYVMWRVWLNDKWKEKKKGEARVEFSVWFPPCPSRISHGITGFKPGSLLLEAVD
jgi:hypothetical protein